MNLRPELLATLVTLGVNGDELVTLGSRMLSAVSSLEASLNALDGQIRTLQSQRDAVAAELTQANITVSKLIESE